MSGYYGNCGVPSNLFALTFKQGGIKPLDMGRAQGFVDESAALVRKAPYMPSQCLALKAA